MVFNYVKKRDDNIIINDKISFSFFGTADCFLDFWGVLAGKDLKMTRLVSLSGWFLYCLYICLLFTVFILHNLIKITKPLYMKVWGLWWIGIVSQLIAHGDLTRTLFKFTAENSWLMRGNNADRVQRKKIIPFSTANKNADVNLVSVVYEDVKISFITRELKRKIFCRCNLLPQM